MLRPRPGVGPPLGPLAALPTPLALYCSLCSVTVLVTAVFVPAATAKCPDNVWDQPVDLCSLPMELARPSMHNYSLPIDARINKTCEAWMESSSCFRELRRKCQEDRNAVAEIWIFEKRYQHYSLPCFSEEFRYRQRLLDCFQPYIQPTRKCLEAFDRTYREFVLDDQFSRACRVVAIVMKCLDDTKKKIRKECSHEGAEEYSRNYIQPIVIQIRPTVSHRCDMNGGGDYMEYFNGSSKIQTQNGLAVSMATVIIVVSRLLTIGTAYS